MKVREADTESILSNLRTFSYTTVEDGETVTKNVELFSSSQTPIANRFFLQSQGDLRADDILVDYKNGDISDEDLAGMILVMIKSQLVQLWKEWEADYNPLWNVDGIEKRTIKTEFGKIVTHEKDSRFTDEQKVGGKDDLTHGLEVSIEEPTNTREIAAFDSPDTIPYTKDHATTHENKNKGTDKRVMNLGKIEHASSGKDTDKDGGDENVTDIYERHGNIGVTMSTQLLRDGDNFWSNFNFFENYFSMIAEQISIPIYD